MEGLDGRCPAGGVRTDEGSHSEKQPGGQLRAHMLETNNSVSGYLFEKSHTGL